MSEKVNCKIINSNTHQFLFENVPINLVNMLRREILTNVETWAVEYVGIHENGTNFPDEIVSHRLSMVPLTIKNPKLYENGYTFSVEIIGRQIVTARQLFKDTEIILLFEGDINLFTISTNKSLSLEITVQIGTMKEHAKWQSCIIYHDSNVDFKKKDGFTIFDENTTKLFKNALQHYKKIISKKSNAIKNCQEHSPIYENTILTIEQIHQYTPKQLLHFGFEFILKLSNL